MATAPTPARAAIEAIEQAGLASWPALEEQRITGWLLRASDGYTRRTNSANTAGAHTGQLDDDLPWIERFFMQRGLPPTFRLLSTPEDLAIDRMLAQRGYRLCEDPCSVMARSLAGDALATPSSPSPPRSSASPHRFALLRDAETWLREFVRIKDDDGPHQKIHLAMLRALAHPTAFALVRACDGEALACGLGVVAGKHLGLFDIATAPAHRRQGLGKALCEGLLAWARDQGAHTAYLQVVADNHQAVDLYRRLGFEERYQYWYRTRE
jgi:ribosomal protein S18 acetylase RimI-like enzyme